MNQKRQRRAAGRKTFNVPATSGNYAEERLTLGKPSNSGTQADSFEEVTALAESLVTGATVELWLSRLPGDDKAASALEDSDFTNSGLTTLTAAGVVRWLLSGWPVVQIRVKSGGTLGEMAVSATAI